MAVAAQPNSDYYAFLGIPNTASENDIKKAYYKLAIKYHPDKNPGDETAKEKFQQLSKIYNTLSNLQKRAAYDQYGEVDEDEEEGGDEAEEGEEGSKGFTLDELEELFRKANVKIDKEALASMQANLDYQQAKSNMTKYTDEIIAAEVTRAAEMKVTEVDFSQKQIKTLPASIGSLSAVRQLILRGNKLSQLPKEFGELKALKHLDLDNNHFEKFPEVLVGMKQLVNLSLQHNYLSSLPATIAGMVAVETLNFFGNQLTSVPMELTQLKKLKALDLECNYIEKMPFTAKDFAPKRVQLSVDDVVPPPSKRRKKAPPPSVSSDEDEQDKMDDGKGRELIVAKADTIGSEDSDDEPEVEEVVESDTDAGIFIDEDSMDPAEVSRQVKAAMGAMYGRSPILAALAKLDQDESKAKTAKKAGSKKKSMDKEETPEKAGPNRKRKSRSPAASKDSPEDGAKRKFAPKAKRTPPKAATATTEPKAKSPSASAKSARKSK